MELVFEGVNADSLDLERIAEGVSRVAQQAPNPDDVTIVFTSDFASSVTARSSNPSQYTVDRLGGSGVAAAMTIDGQEGRSTIIATAAFFVTGAEVEELGGVRLLAHEGWHVAIQQRSEETSDIRFRRELGHTARGFFTATAGVALGEYRVERSLCNEGWWPLRAYIETLPDVIAGVRARLQGAVVPGPDMPDRAWSAITQDQHQLLTHLAYVAAEELASGRTRVPAALRDSEDWRVVVGPFWDRLLSCLDRVPAADVLTPLRTLDSLTDALASEVTGWLDHLGLEVSDVAEGIYLFYSGRPL